MVEMFFSLKFRSQLARIRPELVTAIENGIINSAQVSGAAVRRENKAISARFDESKIGFWLDIMFVIETIRALLANNKRELYGHICVFARTLDVDTSEMLKKNLSRVDDADAVWCAASITEEIKSFAGFKENAYNPVPPEASIPAEDGADSALSTDIYYELDTLRDFSETERKFPLRKKIEKTLLIDKYKSAVITGPEFIGKSDALFWYCREENGIFHPLVIRFTKHNGINCFTDAYSCSLSKIADKKNYTPPERLLTLHNSLFAERLRREIPSCVLKDAHEFLTLLLEAYLEMARNSLLIPVVLLENIENAQDAAARIFFDVWAEASKKKRVVALGTCSRDSALTLEDGEFADAVKDGEWRQVFSGVINCAVESPQPFDISKYSISLLETAYTCFLLGKFFPVSCFTGLFEEEGKNDEVLKKSLDVLASFALIVSADNPSPAISGLEKRIEAALGARTEFIKQAVRNRLQEWVEKGKLSPCFDLLEALRGLGAGASCLLTLECIKSDITKGTFEAVETAIAEGRFAEITGDEYAPSILYIYKTLKSLMYESEADIIQTFKMPPPERIPNTEFAARILSIQALYRMGIKDTQPALDQIKESMLLYQETKERSGISLVYRLFSLLNLSKHEISDAIDYLNYAVEYNKKSKDENEKTLGCYYSSIVHFIFGNISKAERIMNEAALQAQVSGSPAWALKSGFMLARYSFETGEYAAARKQFESLSSKYGDIFTPEWSKTIQAWIERTKLYLGFRTTSLSELQCDDALLFRLEETYLNEEYETTVNLADKILAGSIKDEFVFLEQPCWNSGFSQCELIPFTKRDFFGRVAPVWRSLALTKLGSFDEAVHTIQKIMRDERLNETDPNMPFYFFANYRITVEAGLSEVDRNTAISMAFKRLQRRAGRIDDVKTRQSYLSNQYWNNALFTTAKEYKLI
ncbi:MAG: hypothetical protein LBG72_03625 [Spirochaetaceae bacterium]|jgi:tetratricopeptide (TPR) repeat protein|nr:hypothetical protein [Spirochaetaceae bacterium]